MFGSLNVSLSFFFLNYSHIMDEILMLINYSIEILLNFVTYRT
jgi:hypothetical protein